MVKKLVGVGLASILAVSLWSSVPPAARHIVKQIRKMETAYRVELRNNDVDLPAQKGGFLD